MECREILIGGAAGSGRSAVIVFERS
jgi:hypothetical protein